MLRGATKEGRGRAQPCRDDRAPLQWSDWVTQPVAADLWWDERVVQESSALWEHSIGLPFCESVLSLLWIKDRIERYSDDDEPEPEEADPYRLDSVRRRRERAAEDAPDQSAALFGSGRVATSDAERRLLIRHQQAPAL
jgi:hypothetical protein